MQNMESEVTFPKNKTKGNGRKETRAGGVCSVGAHMHVHAAFGDRISKMVHLDLEVCCL